MNVNSIYDVTIQQMELCIQVANSGSFTSTALAMYTTQSTVSKQIKNLEDRIGFSIFNRERGASLSLTPAGSIIVDRFKSIVKDYNLAIIDADNKQRGDDALITIATTPSANNDIFLLPCIDKYIMKHPDVKVHIRLLSVQDSKHELINDKVDIVVCNSFRKDLFYGNEFRCTDLIKCPWSIGMRDSNLLAGRLKLAWHDLRNQNFVIVNEYSFMKIVNDFCATAGFEPKISYASSTFSGFADNTRDNKTVYLTDRYLKDYGKSGYKYFDMPDTQSGVMMILKSNEADSLVTDFSKQLVKYVEENNF